MEPVAETDAVDPPIVVDGPLWDRSLAGDGGAFGVLFDRHRDRAFQHALQMVGTQHDAEDVVASAFLELWRRRGVVRLVNGSVLPWLLVTTTNLALNSARGTRRYRRFLERLPRAGELPDVVDVAMGIDPRLRAGLRSLSPTDAQLIALVALEGFPVGDAAELLGLSAPAARTRLNRARTKLQNRLGTDLDRQEARGRS